MQSAEWNLPALRKIAGGLLDRKEKESLSIMEWDESWNSREGWIFSPGTVARYRGGLLLVRAAEDVDPQDLLRHELGHHVSLHSSGRWNRLWLQAQEAGMALEVRRGLCEGFADAISMAWGGIPNPVYVKRAMVDGEFGAGYERGRRLPR